jgi:hypothetical protein
MAILASVTSLAPLGAAMKMIKYKTPAILALSRGDALAIRLIMSAVVKLFARPYPHGTVYLEWRLRGRDLLGRDDGLLAAWSL